MTEIRCCMVNEYDPAGSNLWCEMMMELLIIGSFTKTDDCFWIMREDHGTACEL